MYLQAQEWQDYREKFIERRNSFKGKKTPQIFQLELFGVLNIKNQPIFHFLSNRQAGCALKLSLDAILKGCKQ